MELLRQRRVWAALVSVLAFFASYLHLNFQFDVPVITDLLTAFGGALAATMSAVLALWSYLKPKPSKK